MLLRAGRKRKADFVHSCFRADLGGEKSQLCAREIYGAGDVVEQRSGNVVFGSGFGKSGYGNLLTQANWLRPVFVFDDPTLLGRPSGFTT